MKALYGVLICTLFVCPALAVEIDDAVITVPTGWTVEKAQYENAWLSKSEPERQASVGALAERMNVILPLLPQDVYDAEEGRYVGYCGRLQDLFDQLVAAPDAPGYAEMAYVLDQAEAFHAYVERQKTLPRNAPDMPYGGQLLQPPDKPREETSRQGVGWIDNYVDGSFTDHWTPRIATFDNMIWVGATNDAGYDTFEIWHSTNAGQDWTLWHNSGVAGPNDRWLFDLSIDPESTILYAVYYYNNNDIWLRRWLDLGNSGTSSIFNIESATDNCTQPVLSVEHAWSDHRVCCMYYNATTDQIVIKQSTDRGATWNVVHTTSWTNPAWPRPKGASGATSASTDGFYFVAQKSANTLTVFESTSGLSGSWTETDYVHTANIEDVDIAASHNSSAMSTVVAFGYPWTATDLNVRVLFRTAPGGTFISQLVDGDGAMTRTPVIACDREHVYGNHTNPDYYHLAYYKHLGPDDLYYPFALRCLNDSTALDNFTKTLPAYHQAVGGVTIDTLASASQYGRAAAFYQIDITTIYNAMHNQYFPNIAWMRYWPTFGDADPKICYPDQNVGIASGPGMQLTPLTLALSPNPIRSTGHLTYALAERSMVNVSLYDATGSIVRMLVNEQQAAGQHTVPMANDGLAAGVYFVRVTTDQGTTGKMMVVVR
ncbi:T9SS type A sorting domain-containing protein [candidate division WOR-3 bacterium]|nr:T9SS type A sorting domain-containing protein [candidate division WOR-3 bacterium]